MTKNEYFIKARTFAAPFVSETINKYIEADTPSDAMEIFLSKHLDIIYAANVYSCADDYYKDIEPLYKYRSDKARKDYGN